MFYVIAEYDTSHWVQNLRMNPAVKVRVGEKSLDARARILEPEKDAKVLTEIHESSSRKYGWGEGTVVELRPSPVA